MADTSASTTNAGVEHCDLTESQRVEAVLMTVDRPLGDRALAEAAGVELILNDYWLERLHQMFTARGRRMTENNKIQAMLPEGSELIENPIGTACGFAIDIGQARFYFTPGVPPGNAPDGAG